jgi:hypothetical protein
VAADALCAELGAALARFGLNLIGAAPPAAYDALVPATHRIASGARAASVIVLGNGGGAFWSAYRRHVHTHPELETHAHPVDEFTRTIMEEEVLPLVARAGVRATLRLPFDSVQPPLSFVHLAEAAGLGRRSILGVLIHPEFGPWIALRGALLIDRSADAPRPAAAFDPCPSCVERPCVAACPAGAVTTSSGWDVERCMEHRLADEAACAQGCHARIACVYGRAHHYPEAALAYHQGRARAVMASHRAARTAAAAPGD